MFLRIVFWLLTVFYTLLITASVSEMTWALVDWISFIVVAIGIVSLYGLAYKKQMGTRQAWRLITPMLVIYWIAYTFYLDQHFGAYPAKTTGDAISTLVGGLPILVAAIAYTQKLKR